MAHSPNQNENFVNAKNSWKTEIKLFPYCAISYKTTVSLKCFVKDYTSITLVKYKIADQIYQHLKINEEYHQRKNVKGNVDEQLADVRKQVNKN